MLLTSLMAFDDPVDDRGFMHGDLCIVQSVGSGKKFILS